MRPAQLLGIVLVIMFVGMIVGIGIIALDQIGTASRTTATYSETVNAVANNTDYSLTYNELVANSEVVVCVNRP